MFRFANTDLLYLLLTVPVLVALFEWSMIRRRRRLEVFGRAETMARLTADASPKRLRTKFVLFVLAIIFLIFAAARPQFGSKLKEVQREGVEIMLAVDVSNSMLASDFEPNRLERTKYAVGRILDGLQEDKIGVIIFAGDAYVQLPITGDYTTARNFVSQISPTLVTKQGTAIGSAISLAAGSFSSQSDHSRVVVLVTDGENHEDDAIAAAQRAAAQGIKIYVIGIGTPEGAPIAVGDDFIRDDKGEIVVSKLDETSLQEIAATTGGAYVRATNRSFGLEEIIEMINRTEKAEFSTEIFEEFDEQYIYPLVIAIFFLLLELVVLPRRNHLFARFNIFGKEAE